MSEQPVPCKLVDNCAHYVSDVTCNPTCDFYNPVHSEEVVSPEVQKGLEIEKELETEINDSKNLKDVNLKLSGLEKFDKKHEFMVIKKHIFELQSVSPKKIILKYKRKLNKTDQIADGCYMFTDKNDKLLEPHKVFTKFDRDAKAKQVERLAKEVGLREEESG